MSAPRLATYVLGGCTGCHLSLLDAHEELVELLGVVELVESPLSASTPSELPECDIALVEGAISNSHDEEVARQIRDKSKVVIAMGACATLGGIGGLRNLTDVDQLLGEVYGQGPKPGMEGARLPRLTERVRPLSDVITVDLEVPGCSPPTANLIGALRRALEGDLSAPTRRNLCHECGRRHEKMLHPSRDFVSDGVVSIMELDTIDTELCFLEQGVVCMGPMSRDGCGARCTKANVPCRGCNGPSRLEFEQGGKAIDMIGAVLPSGALMIMEDLIGIGYRYSMGVSVFPQSYRHDGGDDL